jgi:hypothetical protein
MQPCWFADPTIRVIIEMDLLFETLCTVYITILLINWKIYKKTATVYNFRVSDSVQLQGAFHNNPITYINRNIHRLYPRQWAVCYLIYENKKMQPKKLAQVVSVLTYVQKDQDLNLRRDFP